MSTGTHGERCLGGLWAATPALQEICKLVLSSGLAVMREGSIAARQLLHDLDLGDDVEAKVLDADVRGDHADQMYVDAMFICSQNYLCRLGTWPDEQCMRR